MASMASSAVALPLPPSHPLPWLATLLHIPPLRRYFAHFLHWDEWFKMARTCKPVHSVISGREVSEEERMDMFDRFIASSLQAAFGVPSRATLMERFSKTEEDKEVSYFHGERYESLGTFLEKEYPDTLKALIRQQIVLFEQNMQAVTGVVPVVDFAAPDLTFDTYGVRSAPSYASDMYNRLRYKLTRMSLDALSTLRGSDDLLLFPDIKNRFVAASRRVSLLHLKDKVKYQSYPVNRLQSFLSEKMVCSIPLGEMMTLQVNDPCFGLHSVDGKVQTETVGDVMQRVYMRAKRRPGWVKGLEEEKKAGKMSKTRAFKFDRALSNLDDAFSRGYAHTSGSLPPPLTATVRLTSKGEMRPLFKQDLTNIRRLKTAQAKLREIIPKRRRDAQSMPPTSLFPEDRPRKKTAKRRRKMVVPSSSSASSSSPSSAAASSASSSVPMPIAAIDLTGEDDDDVEEQEDPDWEEGME